MGAIPDLSDLWAQDSERNESGGFKDVEPLNVKDVRGGQRACGPLKGRVTASLRLFGFSELSWKRKVNPSLIDLPWYLS